MNNTLSEKKECGCGCICQAKSMSDMPFGTPEECPHCSPQPSVSDQKECPVHDTNVRITGIGKECMCSPQPLQSGTRTLKQTLKTIENIRSLEDKEGEDLDQSIKKIRHSWGEISEYCQDEIIDFVDNYVDKEKQRTAESIIDYIEDTLILLGIEHAGIRIKGEWINKDELVEHIKSKYLKNK